MRADATPSCGTSPWAACWSTDRAGGSLVRKLVVYTLMSLDGDVDNPGGYFVGSRPDAAPHFDDEMIENERRVIATQDTVLLGRHMYDEWSGYWPTSNEQPFADFINGVHKVVVTSSPLTRTWNNAEAASGPVEDVVRTLKSQPGKDIGVHGSITLAQSLLAAGLADELQLVVGPAAGFRGRRLFDTSEAIRRLELLSATSTPSGCLILAYRLP
jgi:dihydrofolate reductase